jgi:pantetheine-phosphate adenylyltransferase
MLVSLNSIDPQLRSLQEMNQVTRRAIYPGTFDPVTMGHLDIIERSSKLFDEIIVAVLLNINKQPMFSTEERVEMIRQVTPWANVRVGTFEGLLVDYAKEQEAQVIVRGIRAVSDYEYELQMALMNRRLEPGVETVFLMAAEAYSYLSSQLIKEVFKLGGSISGLVPESVERRMREKPR